MRTLDLTVFALHAVGRQRLRSALLVVAVAIGITAVMSLTALGEGARRYVINEFSSLGTNLLIVVPGRNETTGGAPPLLGETPRDLTLDDAIALTRTRLISRIAPVNVGSAAVSVGSRERDSLVLGTTKSFTEIRQLTLSTGRFLPDADMRRASPVCVIGSTLRDELFGASTAVGNWLRIADRRFRVIGVLETSGQSLTVDLDNVVIIPVASAQRLFNTNSLLRILVEVPQVATLDKAEHSIIRTIRDRHDGEDDITVIAQDALLSTFDKLFLVLTLGVGGIAAISLAVSGILIMNVTLVSVSQRKYEIGLLKALGASRDTIRTLFVVEAVLISLAGILLGLAVGVAIVQFAAIGFPQFPLATPSWAALAAIGIALGTGIIFAVIPAGRAARMDPVQALGGH